MTPAHAQVTWSGTGSNSSWSTSGNWSTALGNNFSSALVFDGTSNLTNTNDRTSGTATGITFNAGAGAFTIGGQAITLNGNITNSTALTQTINTDLAIGNVTRTLTLGGTGGTLVLAGNISGAGALSVTGPATGISYLTLSGSNSFAGNVGVGVRVGVNINNANALGSASQLAVRNSGAIDNTSGADIQLANTCNILVNGNDGAFTFNTTNSLNFGDNTFSYTNGTSMTLTVNGSGIITLGSLNPSGSQTFTKSGSGGLALRNAAAAGMAGAVTLSQGMVQLGHDRSLGDGAIGFNGATLQSLSGSRTLSNTVSIGGVTATPSIVSGTNSLSFSGAMTGASANPRVLSNNLAPTALLTIGNLGLNTDTATLRTLTISGSGNTLITGTISDGNASRAHNLAIESTGITTISGTGSYGGTTQVNAGTLVFRSTAAKAAGTVTAAAAGSIGLGVGGSGYYSSSDVAALFGNTLTGFSMNASSGVAADTTAGDFTISNALTGSRAFSKLGANTLTLSTANTYSGTTSIVAGAVRATHATALGGTTAGTVVASGAALELSNGIAIGAESLSLAGTGVGSGGALRNVSGNNSLAGDITGAAAFSIKSDAGVLTLSGGNTSSFARTFGGAGDIKVTGAFSGVGAVIKVGAGALTLEGAGHAGSFTIQEGRLNINAANALGASSGSLSLAGGVSLDNTSGALVTIGNAKPIGLGASLNFLGSNSLSMGSGAVTLSGNAAIDVAANTLTFGGDVVGTGYGITKTGAGTLVLGGLSGSNSYTGNTRIQGGRLQLTGLSVMGGGSSTVVTIDQGAYLEVGPTAGVGNVTINTWTGGLITSGTINASVKYTTSGTLGTSDSLVNGVQTIGSGAVISSSSDLFGTNPNTPVTGRIVMENNSRLRATTGFTMSANKGIQLNSGTAIFESASGQLVLPSAISGAGSLMKTGTGAMTLSGINSYAGTTTVEAGALVVNGSLGSGNLTVQSGATLKGNGTINGFTTIDGIHAPGNSPGLETFTNGLSYGSGSVLVWELSANTSSTSARGSLYDGIDLTGGALSIASGATLNLVFDAALSNGGGLSTVDWDDPFWGSSQTWKVIDAQSGSWTPGVFTLGSIGADVSGQAFASSIRSGATFSVSQSTDGSIYVHYVIVPEPTAWAIAGVGAVVLAWSCQRRRGRKP